MVPIHGDRVTLFLRECLCRGNSRNKEQGKKHRRSMLKIKPILHVNYEGKLIPREKVQGRKKSLKVLAQKAVSLASPKEGQTLFIGHGDCEEDAKYTLACMKDLGFEPREVLITAIGAIIGAHSGPGTLAVFFLGDDR